jgi:thioredoxin-related protein
MRNTLFCLTLAMHSLVADWHTNLDQAFQMASQQHKHILLNFSGSDWCGPCIRFRKEVLDHPDFLSMADSSLILVNADFPRMKKNQLSSDQQKINNAAADKYNPQGKFPYTLLVSEDGKVIKTWEGDPGEKPAAFAREIRALIDQNQ